MGLTALMATQGEKTEERTKVCDTTSNSAAEDSLNHARLELDKVEKAVDAAKAAGSSR